MSEIQRTGATTQRDFGYNKGSDAGELTILEETMVENMSAAGITTVINDDSMATASETTVATSESIKAYVDSTGGGTVNSVSVTTVNGVSGTVATSTTTPAISLTLGAITPSSVNGNTLTTGTGTITITGTKTLTVSNTADVSGTNSGDQSAGDFAHDSLSSITGTAGQYNHPNTAQMSALHGVNDANSSALALDQTTPQSIINGVPLLVATLADFTSSSHVVNKEYVDSAISFIENFYLNNTADALGGIYYQMPDMPTGEAESSFTLAGAGLGAGQAIANWGTVAGVPGITVLKGGIYDLHIHAEKTAGNRDVVIYYEVYTTDAAGGTQVLRMTSENSSVITSKAPFDIHAVLAADITIAATDRIFIKLYATITGGSQATTVVVYAEGDNNSNFAIPTSTEVLSTVFIRQDGTKAFTGNQDFGANDITGVGSLGVTGAGKLTKVWTVDLESTNLPTINGGTLATALSLSGSNTGDQVAGDFAHDSLSTITGTAGQYNHPNTAQMAALHGVNDANSTSQPVDTQLTAIAALADAAGTLTNDGAGNFSYAAVGTGDMVLASIQSVTGLKTFDTTKLAVKGSSTGTTAVASANASATSYTATLQAATGTLAYTADITGTNSNTNTGDQTTMSGISDTIANFNTALSDGSFATGGGTATGTNTGDNTVCTSGTATSAGVSTNIAGGLGGQIPYQSAVNTTALLANGTAGQILQANGTTVAPSWVAAGAAVGQTFYIGTTQVAINRASATLNLTGIGTVNTHTIQGGTGTFALTSDITGTNSGTNTGDNSANSSVAYIGTTSFALNRASAALTLAGITLTTPNIGTPSAGTLTSCTGLPASGVGAGTFAGAVVTADHGTASTAQVVSVAYGTGAAPTANTTPIGSLYITYTA